MTSSSASVSSHWLQDSFCRGISSQRSSMYLHPPRPLSPIRPQSQVSGVRRFSYLFFFFLQRAPFNPLYLSSWHSTGSPALERSLGTIMLLPLSPADFSHVSRKCLLSLSEFSQIIAGLKGSFFWVDILVLVLEEQHLKSRLSDAHSD